MATPAGSGESIFNDGDILDAVNEPNDRDQIPEDDYAIPPGIL